MTRLLAFILAVFTTAAVAQTKDTPTFQIDGSGATRCVYVWDPNNTTATDKGLPFGCIDGKGAWNLPPGLRNARTINETDLRGYGYVGDGTSRPLSSVAILNGRSTAGWTLAQWQAALPGAQALTDNIDEAAIASAISASTGDLTINLGPGTIVLTRPLILCGKTVMLQGASLLSYNAVTKFVVRHAGNGIEHCASAPQSSRMELRNLDIDLDDTFRSASSGSWAIYDRTANWTRLDNIVVTDFNNCARLFNPSGTVATRVQCRHFDGSYVNNGIGFLYEGTNSFENKIYDSGPNGFKQSYVLNSLVAGFPGAIGLEDFTIQNSGCGHTETCITVDSDSRTYGPLFFKFIGMSAEATGQFVRARSCTDMVIRDGIWLVSKKAGGSTFANNLPLFEFGGDNGANGSNTPNCAMIRVNDNMIFAPSGGDIQDVFRVNRRTTDVVFANNQIGTAGFTAGGNGSMSGYYYYLSDYTHPSLDKPSFTRANSITEYGTYWRDQATPFLPPTNAYGSATDPSGGFGLDNSERAYTRYDIQMFGRAKTTLGTCSTGTGSAMAPGSTNASGTVHDDGTGTSCVINFGTPKFNFVPRCQVRARTGSVQISITSITQNAITYTRSAGPVDVDYSCSAN
ncbi:hypothetical protein [Labrys neptuniae]|uniref:Right-handed parallel beta-helix repeat-containing protein n=1 Tax=Labrys neptuniae TaxID=376174 RepID=A0ABV3PG19_9HYPH